jgi:hypothetical protein
MLETLRWYRQEAWRDGQQEPCITFRTKRSGPADAELQLLTGGHSRRENFAIYQHVAVDGQLANRYQAAMKEVELWPGVPQGRVPTRDHAI